MEFRLDQNLDSHWLTGGVDSMLSRDRMTLVVVPILADWRCWHCVIERQNDTVVVVPILITLFPRWLSGTYMYP